WLTPPAYVRDVAVPAIERGRRRAGKTLDGFEIVVAVPLAITDNRAPALAAFQNELTRYLMLPFYRAMLEAAGLGEHIKAFDRDGTTTVALADALGSVPPGRRTYIYGCLPPCRSDTAGGPTDHLPRRALVYQHAGRGGEILARALTW